MLGKFAAAAHGVMVIGGILDDLNQVTQRIEENMTLSALGFVTPVISSFFAGQEGLNAL